MPRHHAPTAATLATIRTNAAKRRGSIITASGVVDGERETVWSLSEKDARDQSTWPEDALAELRAHAESCGPGSHRYRIEVRLPSGKEPLSTSFVVLAVEAAGDAAGSAERTAENLASAKLPVAQLLAQQSRAIDQRDKVITKLVEQLTQVIEGQQSQLMRMQDRQRQLEDERDKLRDGAASSSMGAADLFEGPFGEIAREMGGRLAATIGLEAVKALGPERAIALLGGGDNGEGNETPSGADGKH